jgi:hypothetical protein
MISVDVVFGTLWPSVMVTSVVRLAAEQVDAAQHQIGTFARHHDMDFLPHELAAGIDHIEASLASVPSGCGSGRDG